MKFLATFAPLFSLASVVLATTDEQAAPTAVDPSFLDKKGWTEVESPFGFILHGTKKKLGPQQLAFVMKTMRIAYNTIHFDRDDDFVMIDADLTSVEASEEASTAAADSLAWNWFTGSDTNSLSRWRRRSSRRRRRNTSWGYSGGGRMHYGCWMCLSFDDDSLELGQEAALATAPMDNLQPIADLMCKILNEKGDQNFFGSLHNCKIFAIESLETFKYQEESPAVTTKETVTDGVDDSNVAITLSGLDCGDDFVDCNDDVLREAIGNALFIAYNEVYFRDYALSDFEPSSLKVFKTNISPATSLRGSENDDADSDNMVKGTWYGTLNASCRFCDTSAPEDPFKFLLDVEKIFCDIIGDIAEDMVALHNFQECSLAAYHAVTHEELSPYMKDEDVVTMN